MWSHRYTGPAGRYGALALALGLILALGGVTLGGGAHAVRQIGSRRPAAVRTLPATSLPTAKPTRAWPTAVATVRPRASRLGQRVTLTEYRLPHGAGPLHLAWDAQGHLWFTEFKRGRLGELLVGAHTVREFPLSSGFSHPDALAIDGHGNIWVTESSGNRVDEITPHGSRARLAEWFLPRVHSRPEGLALSRDGMVWLTEYADRVARLNPRTGRIDEYYMRRNAHPQAIQMGSGGPLWVDEGANELVSVRVLRNRTAKLLWVSLPNPRAHPNDLLVERSGDVVAESGTNALLWVHGTSARVWLVRPVTHRLHVRISETVASQAVLPQNLYHLTPQVLTLTVRRGAGWTEWKLPRLHSPPYALGLDPRGNRIWVTEEHGNRVAMVRPLRGRVLEFLLPQQSSRPRGIQIRRLGHTVQVWIAAYGIDRIDVLDT